MYTSHLLLNFHFFFYTSYLLNCFTVRNLSRASVTVFYRVPFGSNPARGHQTHNNVIFWKFLLSANSSAVVSFKKIANLVKERSMKNVLFFTNVNLRDVYQVLYHFPKRYKFFNRNSMNLTVSEWDEFVKLHNWGNTRNIFRKNLHIEFALNANFSYRDLVDNEIKKTQRKWRLILFPGLLNHCGFVAELC